MDGYSISQVAERTGFSASALRFYEQSGLVRPDRTPAGYRRYDDHHVELLRFVGRAKGFGLTLDEIADLVALLDDDRCAPVQQRMRAIVEAKIDDAQRRIAELVSFTAELQRVAAGLRVRTPSGPCDDTCGCTGDPATEAADGAGVADGAGRSGRSGRSGHGPGVGADDVAVRLVDGPGGRTDPSPVADATDPPPIVCTLSAGAVAGRVAEWHELLGAAVEREPIDGGLRVRFGPGTDPAPLAALAAAEQGCCSFFTFGLTIDRAGVALDVTGPVDAAPLVAALAGVAP